MELSPFFEILKSIEDPRQDYKIKHKLSDIITIVIFAKLANADSWEEIELFARCHENFLKEYIELPNGIPSHDTIQRVFSVIDPDVFQCLISEWNHLLSTGKPEKLKQIINIDGKTICGNGNKNQKALHVVSVWSKDGGVCLGQRAVADKENEIIAIPELLDKISIKKQIITIDAMGTQVKIAEKIISKKADYVLALKKNQANFHNDVMDYFDDDYKKKNRLDSKYYLRTAEKAHGKIEIREYYQTDDIDWFFDKKRWTGLKSIGMVEKTIKDGDKTSVESRYYISSLPLDIGLFSTAIREHWSIESMHWHLDVTFREDAGRTLDKTAALNLNIVHKLCLSALKLFKAEEKHSLKRKRYMVSLRVLEYMPKILGL